MGGSLAKVDGRLAMTDGCGTQALHGDAIVDASRRLPGTQQRIGDLFVPQHLLVSRLR